MPVTTDLINEVRDILAKFDEADISSVECCKQLMLAVATFAEAARIKQ